MFLFHTSRYGFILSPSVSHGMSNGDCWSLVPSGSGLSTTLAISDRFATGTSVPAMDATQNLEDAIGFARAGEGSRPMALVAQFKRLLTTGQDEIGRREGQEKHWICGLGRKFREMERGIFI